MTGTVTGDGTLTMNAVADVISATTADGAITLQQLQDITAGSVVALVLQLQTAII